MIGCCCRWNWRVDWEAHTGFGKFQGRVAGAGVQCGVVTIVAVCAGDTGLALANEQNMRGSGQQCCGVVELVSVYSDWVGLQYLRALAVDAGHWAGAGR